MIAERKNARPRVVIVTGASAGIGRAVARAAARSGYATLLVARRFAALQALATELRAGGAPCEIVAMDVCAQHAPQAIVDAAIAGFGGIDVIVNAAGSLSGGFLAAQSDDALRAQFELHLIAPLRLLHAALGHLRDARGQVILIGSGVARVPPPNFGAYPAAKAAVRAAAAQLRRELRSDRIAVTYVDPGAVDTDLMANAGMSGPPHRFRVSAEHVAKLVVRAFVTRPATLNAVPWQTLVVALGELLPKVTDMVYARAPQLAGSQTIPKPAPASGVQPVIDGEPGPEATPERPAVAELQADPFARALEPVARRMERLNLPADSVAGLLVPGTTLELNEVAMRWAGMPNKNERKLLTDVFELLTNAGYLEPSGAGAWRVVRAKGQP